MSIKPAVKAVCVEPLQIEAFEVTAPGLDPIQAPMDNRRVPGDPSEFGETPETPGGENVGSSN